MSNVPNEARSGERGHGPEVWRVVHLPQGGLGAHKVSHGTYLEAVPANANETTKLLYALNSEAAELSLEAAHRKFAAFGYMISRLFVHQVGHS